MPSATNGGLTIESGSATQQELDALVGNIDAGKTTAAPSMTAATPSGEQVESAPELETGTPESEEQKEKRLGGWQRTIKKKDRVIGQLEDTLKEERLARQRLEAQLAGKPAETAKRVDTDAEPDESGVNPKTGQPWKDWKEFNREHTAWVTRQEIQRQSASRTQTEAQKTEHAELEKTFKAHQDRLVAAATKYDDWDEVVEALTKEATVPEPVGLALIELENSDAVLYHLAKNPDLITKLRGMSELKAIIELGRISDSLAKPAPVIPDAQPSPDTKPVSSAPAPIRPVGGSQTQAAPDPGKMPLSEYIKGRNSGAIK